MERKRALLYVLSAIVLFNIVAIVLLQNKTVEQASAVRPDEPEVESPEPVVAQGEPKPLVRVLLLADRTCTDCFDPRTYTRELSDVLNMSVEEAPAGLFDVPRLPAVAFSDALEDYPPAFTENWENVGTVETLAGGEYAGTWYVLPSLNPPYVDTASGEVVGRVTVTYLTMESCGECYDVELNDVFMEESRITPYRRVFIDAESEAGVATVRRYNITAVPTIIMSPDAAAYTNLMPGWNLVGTVEDDGAYVLRDLQRLRVTYYDLAEGRVMRP